MGIVCCNVWVYLLNVVFIVCVNVISMFHLLFPQMTTFLKVQYKCEGLSQTDSVKWDCIEMDNHAFFKNKKLCSLNKALQDSRGTKSQLVNQSPI